jgi:hypothetical protein
MLTCIVTTLLREVLSVEGRANQSTRGSSCNAPRWLWHQAIQEPTGPPVPGGPWKTERSASLRSEAGLGNPGAHVSAFRDGARESRSSRARVPRMDSGTEELACPRSENELGNPGAHVPAVRERTRESRSSRARVPRMDSGTEELTCPRSRAGLGNREKRKPAFRDGARESRSSRARVPRMDSGTEELTCRGSKKELGNREFRRNQFHFQFCSQRQHPPVFWAALGNRGPPGNAFGAVLGHSKRELPCFCPCLGSRERSPPIFRTCPDNRGPPQPVFGCRSRSPELIMAHVPAPSRTLAPQGTEISGGSCTGREPDARVA